MILKGRQTLKGSKYIVVSNVDAGTGLTTTLLRSNTTKNPTKIQEITTTLVAVGATAANYEKVTNTSGQVRVRLWNADKSKRLGISPLLEDEAEADTLIAALIEYIPTIVLPSTNLSEPAASGIGAAAAEFWVWLWG